jgi:hypothetical protein
VVSALLLARLLYQHASLRASLRQIQHKQSSELSSQYPVILVDSEHLSPAVYGFIRPAIYLPIQVQEKLDNSQLRLIIRHEEQHIRQGHLWLNLLWDVLVCVLWFNPLVYFARQQFRHDQELYCDYLVLNGHEIDNSRSYGHALLTTVTATHSVSLLCSWNAFNQLEERIMNIKSMSQKSSKKLLLTVTLAALTTTSLYAIGGNHEKGEHKEIHKEVMIKKGDGESTASTIKIKMNDKQYVEKNGKRYVVEDGKEREMTAAESKKFDDEIKQAERYAEGKVDHDGHHKVIRIEKEEDHANLDGAHKRIRIVKNDKVFEQEDDELFVTEGDKKRKATAEEREEFEQEMREAEKHIKQIDIEKQLQSLQHLDLNFDSIAADIARSAAALEHPDAIRAISKEELSRNKAALEMAREELTRERENIRRGLEVAQLELERFRERQRDMERSSSRREVSSSPKRNISQPH